MMKHTHVAFAFLLGLLLLRYVGPPNTFIYFALVLGFSFVPDMDHPRSWINNRLKITKALPMLFSHRGFLHSLWAGFVILVLMSIPFHKDYAFAAFIGFISHTLIDGMTPMGINYLHPISRLRLHGPIETNSTAEHVVFIVILFGIVAWFI